MGLLKAIMAVCAADGKILRLQQLTRDACMTEENFIIALQKVCDILGCYRLASNISQEVIMQAVNIYMDTYNDNGPAGGQGQGQGQGYNRLQGLGLRMDADAYNRGYPNGPGNGPLGPNNGQWPGGQGQNGAQPPRGPPPGPGQVQRSSFNFDSYEGNPSNRGAFNQGPGQGPGPGPPPQNPGGGFGLRAYPNDNRLNAFGAPGGPGSGRGGYPPDLTEDVLNMNNGAPNSSRGGGGGGGGGSAVSFNMKDSNLSARIARASFPAPTQQHTLQHDMARLQQQQADFPTQPIGSGRMSSRIISPRLPVGTVGDGERREEQHTHSQSAQGSSLNVQSSPFYPTQTPVNSANLTVIKNNAAAAAAAAATQQSAGCLRTAGLSVITAAKMFWDHSHEVFTSIGDVDRPLEDTFEAIVGTYLRYIL